MLLLFPKANRLNRMVCIKRICAGQGQLCKTAYIKTVYSYRKKLKLTDLNINRSVSLITSRKKCNKNGNYPQCAVSSKAHKSTVLYRFVMKKFASILAFQISFLGTGSDCFTYFS